MTNSLEARIEQAEAHVEALQGQYRAAVQNDGYGSRLALQVSDTLDKAEARLDALYLAEARAIEAAEARTGAAGLGL